MCGGDLGVLGVLISQSPHLRPACDIPRADTDIDTDTGAEDNMTRKPEKMTRSVPQYLCICIYLCMCVYTRGAR